MFLILFFFNVIISCMTSITYSDFFFRYVVAPSICMLFIRKLCIE